MGVNSTSGSYTLVASDDQKLVKVNNTVTVPSGVFSAGDAVTVYNDRNASTTISQGGSVTLRLAGTSTTGNRTVSQRGIVTIVCVANNEFVISGGGLT